jgi:integrase
MTVHRSARWRGWFERYRETTAWTDLSLASRRQRENIFEHVVEAAGRQPFAKITTASIMAGRDRRAKTTPAQARKFLDTMRGLFRWAVKAKLLKVDPTAGVANPSAPNSDGFTPWSIEDIATYEARWPAGTRQRVWLDVLVYTGLRRGDAVRFGRQHIHNGIGTIKTEKTYTVVTLPILPVLMKTLDAGPCGDLTFIAGENGRPLTKESFGNLFARLAAKPACGTVPHMDCERPLLRGPQKTAPPSRSSTRSSDGRERRWRRTTPRPLTEDDYQWTQCTCSRTTSEHSIPSPMSKVRARELKQQTNQS